MRLPFKDPKSNKISSLGQSEVEEAAARSPHPCSSTRLDVADKHPTGVTPPQQSSELLNVLHGDRVQAEFMKSLKSSL